MVSVRAGVLALLFIVLGAPSPARADVPFLRGDTNLDGTVSIADTASFGCVFFCALIPDLPCYDAIDVDDNGRLEISDWVLLLTSLFSRSGAIAAPFPEVGPDPTEDDLGCTRYEVTPASATDDVIELGHATALPGGRVSVPLLLQSSIGVESFQIVVRYDPDVFTPALPQANGTAIRDEFLEGTLLDPEEGITGFRGGFLSLAAFPAEGLFRLGCDPSLIQPVTIEPASSPVHVLNIAGDLAEDAEPGRVIELAFAEQEAPFGPVRTELVPENYWEAAARLPGTLRSGSITVAAPVRFVRGDSNLDGALDVSDAIHMLRFLFLGGVDLTCRAAADVDDNGANQLSDSVGLLHYLFLGGLPPQAPWPSCGADPTTDGVDCAGYPGCP